MLYEFKSIHEKLSNNILYCYYNILEHHID
jgi:hypothetical protein